MILPETVKLNGLLLVCTVTLKIWSWLMGDLEAVVRTRFRARNKKRISPKRVVRPLKIKGLICLRVVYE